MNNTKINGNSNRALMVFVDVEAYGQSPFSGEMTEFGAVVLNNDNTIGDTFHGVLVDASPDPDNPAVSLVTSDSKRYNEKDVMTNFMNWLNGLGARVVFVSDNNGYDWQWVNYYFDKCGIKNPFGHSSRRISDYAAGLHRNWRNTQKWKKWRVTVHDHNPVNDARGNVEAFITMQQKLADGEFDK